MRRALLVTALLLGLGLAAAGCGGDDDDDDGGSAGGTTTQTEQITACEKDTLELVTPGQLTIGTDNPGFPPWFEGAKKDEPWDPTTAPTKKGYEAEVAYAIADQLGFTDAEVKWTVVPFNQLFRPGAKDFDFDINQVSYSAERENALDFSDSYYDVEQAVVSKAGSPIADAASLAELKDARLGVQIGTTSYDTLVEVIDPNNEPKVYDTNNDAISALKANQIDGIVVDYPTSLYMSAVQIPNGTVVGRLPRLGDSPERFGVVFEKGNPLRECVNEAISVLREDGTLDRLEQKWIVGSAPPVLD